MAARVEFVEKYWTGGIVDVGIGSGAFIEKWGTSRAKGYDVNPEGRGWLQTRGLWYDVYERDPVNAISLWDVLEHIPNPVPLLDKVRQWVFVSLPLFNGPDHVLRSKHFRRDEHCWYFTDPGLGWFMSEQGFGCVGNSHVETDLGREDIVSYAFRRVARRAGWTFK